jgi:hypothetical protein
MRATQGLSRSVRRGRGAGNDHTRRRTYNDERKCERRQARAYVRRTYHGNPLNAIVSACFPVPWRFP